jgi:signal transduction histidine kinase
LHTHLRNWYSTGSGPECAMLSDPDSLLIESERLQSVFQQLPLTVSVTVINAALTAAVLAPATPSSALLGWLAAVVALAALRFWLRQEFFRRAPTGAAIRRWRLVSVLGALATGLLWGIVSVAMFPAAETTQLFLAFVIGGMCAGATTVSAAHFPTAAAFILPASLPLVVGLLGQRTASHMVSALMVVIFAVSLCLTCLRSHRAFGQCLRLHQALKRQRLKLSQANQQLRAEAAERRTIEATLHQSQKMEAIGHLTGGIAHDFNNLLQVIVGNLNLIRRLTADNRKVVAYAEAAEQAAQRGAELTGSLLAYARRQSLRTERVDVNQLLAEFEPLLRRTLGGTIGFAMRRDTPVPACMADPAHFQSAILNLAINARDAMPQGGTLTIATGAATLAAEDLIGNTDASPGRFVSVAVSDTGTGMTPEVLARVFEPFFTTKDVGKGSGLGLSQVYGFARQSGGHLRLVSAPGEGTTAAIYLPAVEAQDTPEVAVAGDGSAVA